MADHKAKPQQITEIFMDMSPAYIAGANEHFRKARIVFDAFHIMKMAGQALDKVRKDLGPAKGPIRVAVSGLCEAMCGRATASSSNTGPNSWPPIRPWAAR